MEKSQSEIILKENDSIQSDTWRRLKKNKGAVAGMVIIAVSVITAIFSYFVAPDHSPYANRMILEIEGQKPGFRQEFRLIPKSPPPQSVTWLHRLFSGEDDRYTWIPIVAHKQQGDSI